MDPIDIKQLFPTELSEVVLHWLDASVEERVPTALLLNGQLQEIKDYFGEAIVLRLSAKILAEKLPPHTETRSKDVSIETPDSWFDHLLVEHSTRWPLRWIARRRPPVLRTHTSTVELTTTWESWMTYPWAGIPIPDKKFGRPYHARWFTSTITATPVREV